MHQLNSKTKIHDEEEFENLIMFIIEAAGFIPRKQQSADYRSINIIFEVKDLNNKKLGYAIELGRDIAASQALLQIKEKGYYKEVHQCDKIVCMGLALNRTHRLIEDVNYAIFDSKMDLILREDSLSVNLSQDSSLSLKLDLSQREISSKTEKEMVKGGFNNDEKVNSK